MKKIIILILIFVSFSQLCGFKPQNPTFSEYEGAEEPEPQYSSEDVYLLANCIYFENWCNSDKVRLYTGSVVINRMNSTYFPDSVRGVLSQRGQYSTWKKFGTKEIPRKAMHMAEILLKNGSLLPPEVIFQSMFPQGSGIYYTEKGEYFCYE